ncbi:putative signal peptide protein [Puccinia sorghi]|uniref:Putative signal peptide protein n=1 Tax=Puccinia sorghi TaxID=27349 RepID=A0A0L6ULC8_9BASI|nr:putative signal peptide protein [Puccinia sorghi]
MSSSQAALLLRWQDIWFVVGGTGVPSSASASEGVNLDDFKACELEEAGIKRSHLLSLISSLNQFENHLKTHQP